LTTPAIFDRTIKTLKSHSPEILTAFGITGVATTAYLTGKATVTATRLVDESESRGGISNVRKQRIKERVQLVWKLYIPAASSGAITIACIFGAQRVNTRRTTAAVTAYTVAERAFSEYREKVVEQIGKGPEQKVRDKIAQDRVDKFPPSGLVVMGTGHVLCCELYTGRYFQSEMETLKQARNDINARVNQERWVTLSEFYDIIGLDHTSVSSSLGWDADKLMDIQFTSVLAEGKDPCLAFDYNYVKPL